MSLETNTLQLLQTAIANAIIEHVSQSDTTYESQYRKIVNIRSVSFRDNSFSSLKASEVYSGKVISIETILGTSDVHYESRHGGISHSPDFNPMVIVNNLKFCFNHDTDEFEVIDLGQFKIG